MDLHTVCCSLLLLLTCSGRGFGQVLELPESINKTVGENVVITPKRIPHPPHSFVRWNFNTVVILTGPPNGVDILPPYKDRLSFNTTSLALELRSLTESDTGQYVLSVDTTTTYTAHTSLLVLVPVSSVTIVPSQTELVENSTVSFLCSASGSSISFIWLNGSSEITAGERVQLTDNNSKLTITSVMRGDTGPYECEVYNSINRNRSLPFSLTIYYGPENVAVAADLEEPFYISGSNLKLNCSAESRPAAEIHWAVNETELVEKGQVLKLNNIQISHSGNYTCIAYNTQTLQNSVSESISVNILVPVSNVAIIPSLTEVELNNTVSVICSASGSSLSFIWLNGSSEVTAGERVQLTDNNRNLTITSVIRGDTGPYECEAYNSISRKKSLPVSLTIKINVPVSNVAIIPSLTEVELNNTVSFICSASGSSLSFMWLNASSEVTAGERVQLTDNNRNLTITSVIRGDTGPYECEAYNSISRKKSLPVSLTIKINDSGNEGGDGDSLSAGAIAGIVIGVLLAVAAIAGLIFYFVKVKEMPRTNSRGNNQSGATHNAGGHDSQYENIPRFHNLNTRVTVGGSDTQTPHKPHPVMDTYYENMVGSHNNPVMRHTPHPDEGVIYENP
ncbi:carcinoembryonic antigen-related cell adhesion molecule 20-like isoform X2 [Tachysurus fulvidraco]|uniref:carcinoembryonic antigen-related cell adhesion molecule 20-like isoform X2 n=1 Tax=Tachysurus fulvidraco TaxID=1234273 RepID=UPI001FED47B9|nr:carcinoembryonic antigen-related cell adhesion molecule 20-like isoform X2 [Tachysurus fulvidraco]